MRDIPEVFREHLDECLRHFATRFNSRASPGSKGRREAMEPMAVFMGAASQTVNRYFAPDSPLPVGEFRLRLACYLDLHGYKIIEFERMPRVLRYIAEIIGYGVMAPAEVTQRVGYNDASQLYVVIWGKEGHSKEKEERMYDLWKEKRSALDLRKKESFESGRLKILSEATPPSESSVLELGKGVEAQGEALFAIIEGVCTLLEGLPESELFKFTQPILRLSSRCSTLSSKVIALNKED